MDRSLPLVVSLAQERDNPLLDGRRTCNGYIASGGGEGRKHRGWCIHGCIQDIKASLSILTSLFVRQTSTQFPSRTWSTLAARHQMSQRDACVEASQKGLGRPAACATFPRRCDWVAKRLKKIIPLKNPRTHH